MFSVCYSVMLVRRLLRLVGTACESEEWVLYKSTVRVQLVLVYMHHLPLISPHYLMQLMTR